MDQKSKEKAQIQKLLSSMSLEELSYALGRYCGPSNYILCVKKYGFAIPKEMAEKELQIRAIEDILLK